VRSGEISRVWPVRFSATAKSVQYSTVNTIEAEWNPAGRDWKFCVKTVPYRVTGWCWPFLVMLNGDPGDAVGKSSLAAPLFKLRLKGRLYALLRITRCVVE
jgi:hypothetical protein